ncbi:MAG: DUF3696 domain-containing protein [Melioribacteraceae bacterium]|nr:DUF3696 domain-containing protein [Melioribacteraceae bacterium]
MDLNFSFYDVMYPPSNLESIEIRNFKVLTSSGKIKIKPLTLLFGKNGVGKSSFISAINFWKDIINSSEGEKQKGSFALSTFENISSFDQIINSQNGNEKIEFVLTFSNLKEKGSSANLMHEFYSLPPLIEFRTVFTRSKELGKIKLFAWGISDISNKMKFTTEINNENGYSNHSIKFGKLSKSIKETEVNKDIISLSKESKEEQKKFEKLVNIMLKSYEIVRNPFLETGIDSYKEDIGELWNMNKYLKDEFMRAVIDYTGKYVEEENLFEEIINDEEVTYSLESYIFQNIFESVLWPYIELVYDELKKIEFTNIGHIRNEIPRVFSLGDKNQSKHLTDLYKSLFRSLEIKDSWFEKDKPIEKLGKILRELKLADDIIISDSQGSYALYAKQGKSKINIADESSGFRQLFPILLSLVVSKNLLIEQPELHLHPKLQADLMKVIAANRSKNKKIIIETHSEHILRKLQILVAKNEIKKEDVAIYYFDKQNGKTKVKEIKLNDNGFFAEPLPEGFFDESYNLTEELLLGSKQN